jgi:hypothetical protein
MPANSARHQELLQGATNKFMTRLAFAYEYKIPYSTVTDCIRRGEIALHFIDNKVQIEVEEALRACVRKRLGPKKIVRDDLFA